MILKPYGSSTNASIAMPSTIEFCRVIGGEWLRCMVLVDGVGWGERRRQHEEEKSDAEIYTCNYLLHSTAPVLVNSLFTTA